MKKIFSLAVALCMGVALLAQKAALTFQTEDHNFGDIKEEAGPVSFDFEYVNTGKTPLVLHNVQASCGCTTPEWTKAPIQPNGKGVIKVTFNPKNRPGSFSKTITVTCNGETPTKTLRITGNVLQKPKTIEDEYPYVYDGLRLADTHMAFTKMLPGESKMVEIRVINTTENPLTPTFINVPSHVKIAAVPATIQAGETALIQANYDAAKKNDWGFVSDQVYVIFDGVKKYTNRITISATIAEDFSKLSDDELAHAPSISFDSKDYDFGVVTQQQRVEHDYIVTNNGDQKLIIRKVKASCGCTAVNPEKTILEKGESTKIHVTFDPRGKSGRQQKTITIISNDPKSSNMLLRISGTVNPNAEAQKQE